ncbi:MAG: glycosyl transferase family 2 [Patescibacteria group bacterium]|nr:MAG: glycosyl transferase family 2 [Patescibacteria group bacterium]
MISEIFKKIYKIKEIIRKKSLKGLLEKIKEKILLKKCYLSINQQYQIWLKKNYPTRNDLKKQKQEIKKFKIRPSISLITPVYNPEKQHLVECIESVINQSYENWELCLVDDASTKSYVKEILNEYAKKDKRIKVKFRQKNGHICQTSNDALKMTKGEYVALLDHDDFLWPNALYEVVKLINEKPHAQFIYSDEDKLDYDGKTHVDPFFKPDWSPDYLRSINYITHFAVLKKSLINAVDGFRIGTEGAQDWDLFLRATYWLEKNIGHCHPLDKKNPIQHISTVLYSWRKTSQSTASEKHAGNVKNYAYKNQKKVLEDDLKRRKYEGEVLPTKYLGLWRVRYKIIGNPLVSIIIPTKDKYEYISKCLNSILKKTTYKNYELVIIDTGSKDKKVWQLYEKVKSKHKNTQVLKWSKEFNFSAVCNFGAKKSRGEYLLFLNNDTEVITPDWIEGMLEHAQRKEIGAVGCKLLYPNGTIQHAGVILGIKGGITKYGIAGHAFKYFNNGDNGQFFQQLHSIKNYSAITAACLLINKKKFIDFDIKFKIAFNDVDFNLKLLTRFFFNLYTPFCVLKHYESISVGLPQKGTRDIKEFKNEILRMYKKWKHILNKDPFYNKNLTLTKENYSLQLS